VVYVCVFVCLCVCVFVCVCDWAITGGAQWFIADMGANMTVKKIEMKNRYSDNDTVKRMELYYLPNVSELTGEHRNGNSREWTKVGDIVGTQTTDVQTIDVPGVSDETVARFWKFSVVELFGGDITCSNYPCLNNLVIYSYQEMWTTHLSQVEADDDDL